MKRSRTDSETAWLSKRRRVVKTLRTMKEDEDQTRDEGEEFGDYEIKRFQDGLKKRIEQLDRWGEADRVREKGNELVALMRDTARWHCQQYAKGVKEYERLNKSASLARSEEHVDATKELFGIVLDQRDEIGMTLDDADRVMNEYSFEDSLLEEFDRLTEALNKIRDTCYRTFDSDKMHRVLWSCSFDGAKKSWCKKMTFWE